MKQSKPPKSEPQQAEILGSIRIAAVLVEQLFNNVAIVACIILLAVIEPRFSYHGYTTDL